MLNKVYSLLWFVLSLPIATFAQSGPTLTANSTAMPVMPVNMLPGVPASYHRAPYLNLSEGRSVTTRYARESAAAYSFSRGQSRALSTATADFDEDGTPDLVCGFATIDGSAITVHRGNVDARWPYGALRGTDPPAFHPDARVFTLPEVPDFLAVGDFDADGHWDIVAGRSGGEVLYFLKGNGHGNFADAERVSLPGKLTAMTSGEINRADGLTDLMVAVTGYKCAQALVFESPNGALRGTPEVFPLPADAGALAVVPLDGGIMNGLAVATGNELLLVHGRDRRLTRGKAERDNVPEASVTRQTFPFALRSLAVGHFTNLTHDLAALGDDGQIHILERSDANHVFNIGEALSIQSGSGQGSTQANGRGRARLQASSSGPAESIPKTTALNHRSVIGLPHSLGQTGGAGAKLVTARVAATGRDSLIVIDPANRKLHLVSHRTRHDSMSMAVSASLDVASGAPAAVQPMHIGKHAVSDLVVLADSQTEPIIIRTAPDYIWVVTNTGGDINTPESLPNAIWAASILSSSEGATSEINFNIPLTDPNRDPITGVFTIQPIFQSTLVAMPYLAGNTTIDGYSQPGSSPNTLATGDNAHPLIEINGSMAGAGPPGLYLGGDGNVVRGLVLTNFTGIPAPSDPRYINGGQAIDIEGDNNFIEGNFIGIDAGGTFAKPNAQGVITMSNSFAENGSTIGGTAPQARNIISGNQFSGINNWQMSYANTFFIQGNYIGTDKTGTQGVPNGYAGVDLVSFNASVGGTAAGAGNLISGNAKFNVVSRVAGSFPQGNLIQGNLIGTDVTGTLRLTSLGVAAGMGLAGSNGIVIGGTTSAARNIISGNPGFGLMLVAGNQNGLIQGNYIGLDATGSQAVPNGSTGVSLGTDYYDVFNVFHLGVPTFTSTIGGEAAGAGNVISGNSGAGISIISKSGYTQNNVISGNLIGTDATGLNPLGNTGDGILIQTYAAANTIGGTDPAAANVIAYNVGNGVKIHPAPTAAGTYVSANAVIGNNIYANGGAGVLIPSGTGNPVRANRIYANGGLGINIDAPGVQANSVCQASTAGANLLQNAPVLTAGSGSTFVTATATDPAGNTSEFSNCVAATLTGNILNIAGTLNSKPNTTYTIDYFSNASCDASGYGQGKVHLGSAIVTTGSNCTAAITRSNDLTTADFSVTYTSATSFSAVEYMTFPFSTVVVNNGPVAATSVIWTNVLPANVNFLSATATQGTCAFANGTITCNLGNIPVGGTVTVTASILPTTSNSFTNTVSVASSTPDANSVNNTATITKTPGYNPYLHHLSPASVYVGSLDLTLTLVGQGFTPASVVTYGGVTYPATFNGNWNPNDCGNAFLGGTLNCTALAITVPAAQLATPATVQVAIGTGAGSQTLPFSILTPPIQPGTVTHFVLSGIASSVATGAMQMLFITAEDADGLTVPTYRGTVNLTTTDPAPGVLTAGGATLPIVFTAADGGMAATYVEFQTAGPQFITATEVSNPAITGAIGPITVAYGAASNLVPSGTPQATPPGQAFALPLSVTVTDMYGNRVPNKLITFTAPTSGASAILSSTTAITNSQGVASVTATANGISGPYAVGVTFGPGIAGGGANADVFLLTNGTGLATLTATGGTPQSTFVGQLFPTKLQTRLLNGLGNPISGMSIYFNVANIGGPDGFAPLIVFPAVAVTDSSGVVTVSANAPSNAPVGTYPVTATVGGLTATYTLTINTPQPVVMTIVDGSPQSTAAGYGFVVPLTVKVTDGWGTPRPGVVVTFVPPTSGASAILSSGTASTNASGVASLTATANNINGIYNIVASVGNISVRFSLTNIPAGVGPPVSIVPTAGTPQSQTVGQAFSTTMKALVTNAGGIPLPGVSVTFAAPQSGPSGTFTGSTTVTTNGIGVANAPAFTADTVAGSYQVTATAGTVSTHFNMTNVGGAPVSISIYAGDNQSASLNTNFSTPLAVRLFDTYGNPVGANWGGTYFIVDAGTSGASGTFTGSPSPSTDSNGVATAPTLTANGTAGGFPVYAFLNFGQYVIFNLTNTSTYTVTPSAGTNGSINPAAPQTVNNGSTATFTITPDSGYAAVTPIGGTCPQGTYNPAVTTNNYTTGIITANCTVATAFTKSPITVTINQVLLDSCPAVKAYVSVIDQNGDPVTGLTANNFTVNEDSITRTPVAVTFGGAAPISVAMTLDYSGSMSGTPIANLQTAATTFINQLGAADAMEIIKFSTLVEAVQTFTTDKALLVSAVTNSWSGANNSTAFYDAVYKALTDTSARSGRKAVIAMTDGEDNASTHTITQVITYATSLGIPVYTIGLGSVNATVLSQLASSTNGHYYNAPTPADLQSIYTQIANVFQNQYEVTYASGLTDSTQHDLQISVNTGTASGSATRQFTSCSPVTGSFLLSVAITGTGSGSVHSSSTTVGVPGDISCTIGTCSVVYPSANIVTLGATPDTTSTFDGWSGWSGACTTSPCNVTMTATRNVFAAFTLAPMARNVTTSTPYATLAAALSNALSGAEIRVLDVTHNGPFSLDKAINLRGGWNATYQARSGIPSTLDGDFTILGGGSTVETVDVTGKLLVKGGSLRVKGVKVRP